MSYADGRFECCEVLRLKLPSSHPYTLTLLSSQDLRCEPVYSACISGGTLVSDTPISGAPPYDQSEFGNGGDESGDGGARRGGSGPPAAVPFQSSAYARKS